jgi:hypothetical protein
MNPCIYFDISEYMLICIHIGMDECEERRLLFEGKQSKMREQVLKFEKFIQVHTCIYVRINICKSIHVRLHIHVYLYISKMREEVLKFENFIQVYVCVYINVNMYVDVYIYMYIYLRIFVYLYLLMYINMIMYIHVYTGK